MVFFSLRLLTVILLRCGAGDGYGYSLQPESLQTP